MYNNILVPIDPAHEESADRMLAIAKRLLSDDGHITIMSVIEPLPNYVSSYLRDDEFRDRVLENKRHALELVRQKLEQSGVSGTTTLEEGVPVREILREAEKIGADAIIIGSHRPELSDYLLGSTAAKVVRHAKCTVVIDRGGHIAR